MRMWRHVLLFSLKTTAQPSSYIIHMPTSVSKKRVREIQTEGLSERERKREGEDLENFANNTKTCNSLLVIERLKGPTHANCGICKNKLVLIKKSKFFFKVGPKICYQFPLLGLISSLTFSKPTLYSPTVLPCVVSQTLLIMTVMYSLH